MLNLGRYERQAYLHIGGRLSTTQKQAALAQKEREFRELILRAYKAQPLPEAAASFFHGAHNGRLVVIPCSTGAISVGRERSVSDIGRTNLIRSAAEGFNCNGSPTVIRTTAERLSESDCRMRASISRSAISIVQSFPQRPV